jgi:hypothetical protein
MKKIFAGLFVLAMVACGSSISQSTDCSNYVACYDKAMGTTGTMDSTYGKTGTCWTTTQASADACTAACKSAMSTMKTSYPNVTECQK